MLECRRIDELMVDYLYHELDSEQEAAFRAHVQECTRCGTELAGFTRTRAVLAALPEEDPPTAVVARLLREAAVRAPAPASGGLREALGRLFTPLARHPALAAAASLALAAGLAGYLTLHRQVEPGAPRLQTPASAPAEGAGEAAAGGAAPAAPAPAPVAGPPPTGEAAADTGQPADGRAGARTKRGAAAPPPARPEATGKRRSVRPLGDATKAGGGGAGGRAPARPAPPPPAKTEAVPATAATAPEEAASEAGPATVSPARWLRDARAAATDKDCATANRLCAEILRADPAYYQMNVVRDPVLERCLPRNAVKKAGPMPAAGVTAE